MRTRLLITTIAAILTAATAWAGEVPDSARASRLQAQADAAGRVRVTTTRATYVSDHALIAPGGITLSRLENRRPSLKRLQWADIERVDTEVPARGRGFVKGAALGLAISAVAVFATYDHSFRSEPSPAAIVLIPVAIGTGGVVGGVIGAFTASNRTPIYP